ncbi:hypothetical protein LguiA_012885 [Lonicera macranthoides]
MCACSRRCSVGVQHGAAWSHDKRIISLFFKHLLLQWPFSPFLSIYCHKEPLMQVPFLDTKGIVPEDMLEWDQKRYLLDFLAIEHGNFLETNVAQCCPFSQNNGLKHLFSDMV